MKPECVVKFDRGLPLDVVESLKVFAVKQRPDFEFVFEFQEDVFRSVEVSLESRDGAFGSIGGDEKQASIAQAGGLLDALQSELRRISR